MLTVDFDRLYVKEGHLVLDAGCGFGRHSVEIRKRGACVFSMDMDFPSLKQTSSVLESMAETGAMCGETGFIVHAGDALKLPFRDGTFDRIICAEVMEHVSDDYLACSELSRVLKKNGRIAITVPTFFSEMIYDIITYEYFTSPGGHVRKYIPSILAEIMRKNGLEIYSVDFRHSFHTIWWIIRGVVGLHNAEHPLTRTYHRFLIYCLASKFMRKTESFMDHFFPKSIVLYAWKK
jgi:ubiquinone/menaquinone biosynthesis C-methylase UbiE